MSACSSTAWQATAATRLCHLFIRVTVSEMKYSNSPHCPNINRFKKKIILTIHTWSRSRHNRPILKHSFLEANPYVPSPYPLTTGVTLLDFTIEWTHAFEWPYLSGSLSLDSKVAIFNGPENPISVTIFSYKNLGLSCVKPFLKKVFLLSITTISVHKF